MRRGSRRDAAHLFLPTVSICLSAEALNRVRRRQSRHPRWPSSADASAAASGRNTLQTWRRRNTRGQTPASRVRPRLGKRDVSAQISSSAWSERDGYSWRDGGKCATAMHQDGAGSRPDVRPCFLTDPTGAAPGALACATRGRTHRSAGPRSLVASVSTRGPLARRRLHSAF
jgi:hypothetical protein